MTAIPCYAISSESPTQLAAGLCHYLTNLSFPFNHLNSECIPSHNVWAVHTPHSRKRENQNENWGTACMHACSKDQFAQLDQLLLQFKNKIQLLLLHYPEKHKTYGFDIAGIYVWNQYYLCQRLYDTLSSDSSLTPKARKFLLMTSKIMIHIYHWLIKVFFLIDDLHELSVYQTFKGSDILLIFFVQIIYYLQLLLYFK